MENQLPRPSHWSSPAKHCAQFWDPTKVMGPTLRELERDSKEVEEETDEAQRPGEDASKMKCLQAKHCPP